jgi:glycosyltransferase involved in cell wall biosynthesis
VKIAVVIPAFNEAENIANVVNGLNAMAVANKLDVTAVVVNDCSLDNTAAIIAGLPCVALNLPVNLGIGGAVQTGIKYAYRNGFDVAFQLDGDGQHPAGEIPKLVQAHIDNNWDVVIGSRFLTNEGFQSSFARRTGIKYFKHLIRLMCGVRVTDATSGYRLLNRKAMAIVNDYYPHDYPEPEAVVMYARNNLTVGEVPVVMLERQGGVSSIGTTGSIFYMVKVTLAVVFAYFVSVRKI